MLPRRNDAELGPAKSLHASAQYNQYSEKFELDLETKSVFYLIYQSNLRHRHDVVVALPSAFGVVARCADKQR